MLRTLFNVSSRTVTEIAEAMGIHEVVASRHLRLLNSRGLLRVTRISRWVEYRIGHNPSIPETEEILRVLRRQLENQRWTLDDTFRDLTAFTHPRRIRIARVLSNGGPFSVPALRVRTAISVPALKRHLRKLVSRGLVAEKDGLYRNRRAGTPLLRTLVRLACSDLES